MCFYGFFFTLFWDSIRIIMKNNMRFYGFFYFILGKHSKYNEKQYAFLWVFLPYLGNYSKYNQKHYVFLGVFLKCRDNEVS